MPASAIDGSDVRDDDRPSRRRFWVLAGVLTALLAALLVVYLLGRPTLPAFGQVSGVVTLDGEPLPEVEVSLLPDPEGGGRGPTATGFTGRDGRYYVRTALWDHDGAVLGTHRVTVKDWTPYARGRKPSPPADGEDEPPPAAPKASRVPPNYEDAVKTPLRPVEVAPGEQVYDIALVNPPKK